MAEDFYAYDDDENSGGGRDHLFLWTVFILLLIGIAFACWLGSFYIFGHPEKPRPYKILKKLNKIEAPRRFEVTAAPPGEFLGPQKLFERYSRFSRLQLQQENDVLLRNYIKNFRETKRLVPYLTGRFEIIDSYELQKSDIFPSGVVALAQSEEMSQVLVEHVFTTAQENVAALRANLPRGLDMRLEKTRDLAAIIHVERTDDGHLQFTAMPLLYGSWGVKGSVGIFSLEPPPELNLEPGLPVIRGKVLQDWLKTFTELRRTQPRPVAVEGDKAAPSNQPELVRLDSVKPGEKVPETGALPETPVATPIPMAGGKKPALAGVPKPAERARATPFEYVMNATPAPVRAPAVAVATPAPAAPAATPPPKESPSGVPLKSFFGSAPAPGTGAGGANSWRTYAPGKQPAGRTVTASEASDLAERGETGEKLYLRGNFVVTASGESRAVLRAQSGGGEPASGGPPARVIVEFPSSVAPPAEGSTFARDETRAFEVRDVRRGADGQLNIYVREVTKAD